MTSVPHAAAAASSAVVDAAALTAAARIASHALHGRALAPLVELGGEQSLAARAQRIYHSPLYRWPYAVLMLCGGLLALVETPNPLAELRTPAARDAVHAADAIVLLAAAADVVLQATFMSPRVALRRGWTLTKIVVVVALATNLAAHSVLGASAPYVMRALRPLLLIERLRNVRKLFASVFQTAPRIVNIGVLLVLNLLLHAVLGFALFAGMDGVNCDVRRPASSDVPRCSTMLYPPQSCSSFFSTLGETTMHLFELMTAVNFPAVAIPVMRCRTWSPLFFVSFVMTAVYLLFNLALAVAYNEFSVGMRGEVLTRYARVFVGLDAAFLRLAAQPVAVTPPARIADAAAGAADCGPLNSAVPPPQPTAALVHAVAQGAAAALAWGSSRVIATQASTALRMAAASRAEAEAAMHERARASARLGDAAFRQFFVALRNDLPHELAHALGGLLFTAFARRIEMTNRGGGGGAEPAVLDVHAFRRLLVTCADVSGTRDARPEDVDDLLEAEECDVLYVGPRPEVIQADTAAASPRAAAVVVAVNPLASLGERSSAVPTAAAATALPAAPPTLSDLMDARRQRVARVATLATTAAPVAAPGGQPQRPTVDSAAGETPPPTTLDAVAQPPVATQAPASVGVPRHAQTPRSQLVSSWTHFRARWILPLAAHPANNLLFDATTLLAAGAVLTQLTVDTDDAPPSTPALLATLKNTQFFTLAYGMAFVTLRVLAWGPVRFWRRGALNRFDALVVGALTLGTILVAAGALPPSAALLVLFLRFLRLIRVFRHVPGFKQTVVALLSILPVLGRLFLILLAALYAFAIVGMELFAGRLLMSNPAVAQSAYGYYNYETVINFDSLQGSYWTLFYLLSVNDWVVLMEGCVAATGLWARAYFIAFWAVFVLFLLSVFIAFGTVAFDAEKTRRDEGARSSASRGAQRAAARRIGTKRRRASGGAATSMHDAAEGDDEEIEGDVVAAVAGAASALSSSAAGLLGMLPNGERSAETQANDEARQPFVFGDWRATLVASGVDLRGWLLTRRPRVEDVYDVLYKDDLISTFQETLVEEVTEE